MTTGRTEKTAANATNQTSKTSQSSARKLSPFAAAVALVALLLAITGSAVLAVSHLPGYTAPGCGPDGGCAKLKTSDLGVVPATQAAFPEGEPPLLLADQDGWPTAYLGLAFFAAIAASLVVSLRTGIHPAIKWVARAGALASLGYIGAMIAARTLCPWCLGVHIANFAFLAAIELGTRARATASKPARANARTAPPLAPALVAGVAAFAVASVGIGLAHNEAARDQLAAADEEIDDLVDNIANRPPADEDAETTQTDEPQPPDNANATGDEAQGDTDNERRDTPIIRQVVNPSPADLDLPYATHGPDRPGAEGFTGRYLAGPDRARARIVTFASPLCPHCREVKQQINAIMDRFPDQVSHSAKHFPLNAACNPIGSPRAQPGSCQAAYTMEAAGLLGGPAAYWATSKLFYDTYSAGDTLSPAELQAFVRDRLNIPLQTFSEAYNSDQVAGLVRQDIDQAIDMGITGTPAVFINGQVFLYWHVDGALTRAVERALALPETQLPFATSAADARPDRARVLWDNWLRRMARPRPVIDPLLPSFRADGQSVEQPADHPFRLTVFHDYGSERSAEVDRAARELIDSNPRLIYQPRLFPMSETCNPFAEVEQSPHGCRSARFAASVRALATPAQFLQTHDWLLDNRGDFTDDEAREHLAAIGADPDAVMQRLDARDSLNDLVRDTSASNNASPGMRAPVVYLNGRAFVPLEQDGDLVIDDILEQVETDYRTNPGRYLTPEQRNTIR